jgi:glycerol-1-phosphate dehydrogenase [NAD(P)+]
MNKIILNQTVSLPSIFKIDSNIYLDVFNILKNNNIEFKKPLIVSGSSVSFNYAKHISELNKTPIHVLNKNTFSDVESLKDICLENNYDFIISVGGGKIQDSVKRVSYLININHISIPTIISNDGLISPISVLINDNTLKTESLPGVMPIGVIIDLKIINKAPMKYFRAAVGDILSNLSATNDWIISQKVSHEKINDIAFIMSKSSAISLIYFENKNFNFKPFQKQVIQGQINSGIAMSLAGSSRPCSGSEHLISHAIDYLKCGKNILHGEQVAAISLFSLFLQDELIFSYLDYAKQTIKEINFIKNLINPTDNLYLDIYNCSKQMRPGRVTVLDTIDENEFISSINNFINYLEFHESKTIIK